MACDLMIHAVSKSMYASAGKVKGGVQSTPMSERETWLCKAGVGIQT